MLLITKMSNTALYPQGRWHKPNPQGHKCIVYLFHPMFWLLDYPDLAHNQLRLPIKRMPCLLRQLSSLGLVDCLVQTCAGCSESVFLWI